jgi:hypothetical protein
MTTKPLHQEFRRLLDDGLQSDSGRGLSKSTKDRLLLARRKALDAIPRQEASESEAHADHAIHLGASGAAINLGYGRHLGISQADLFKHRWQARLSQWFGRSSWLERLFVATLLASMLFSVQFALEEAEVQVFMREGETDAKLLTNELPLDAYADRGFAVFLRNLSVHGFASVVDEQQTSTDEAPADDAEPETASGS